MRLVERVVGERLDDVEHFLAEGPAVALGLAPVHELRAFRGDEHPVLFAGRLAQVVSLFERVPGEFLADPHQLLLVDHQPEGGSEDLLKIIVVVHHRLAAVLTIRVVGVHVGGHRPRPVQRNQRGHIFEARRFERANERPHRSAFELKHADRVAEAQKVEGLRVVERRVVDIGPRLTALLHQIERDLHHVEVAQPEEVHLEQAQVFDAVHLVLRDNRRVLERSPRLGFALDRQVVGQRITGDHHGRGVNTVLAAQPFEAACHVDDVLGFLVGLVELAQFCGHLVAVFELRMFVEAGVERGVATHDQRRHEFGDLVTDAVGVVEHPSRVAHGGAGLNRGEGDDLRDAIGAIPARGVLDHVAA